MSTAYFHVEDVTIHAPARRCYELVLAVRGYGAWWHGVECHPLGSEGTLRLGSRFRLRREEASWTVEVTGLLPWRRIDWKYVDGDLLGPSRWEFREQGRGDTRVRYAYRGVRENPASMHESPGDGGALRAHREALRADAFAGMRRAAEAAAGTGDLFDCIHTTRAVRRFRPDPVAPAVLRQIIEAATRAPSARNAQPWYFIAVLDPVRKRAVAAAYESAWRQAQAWTAATDADADVKDQPGYDRMMRSVDELASRLDRAPALVLACVDTKQLGPMADASGQILSPQSVYASIFPAVENLILAARALGLGSTLTTVYSLAEADIRRALGIPEHVHVAALLPLGYPTRVFRPTQRKPVEEIAFLDRWGTRLEAAEVG